MISQAYARTVTQVDFPVGRRSWSERGTQLSASSKRQAEPSGASSWIGFIGGEFCLFQWLPADYSASLNGGADRAHTVQYYYTNRVHCRRAGPIYLAGGSPIVSRRRLLRVLRLAFVRSFQFSRQPTRIGKVPSNSCRSSQAARQQ